MARYIVMSGDGDVEITVEEDTVRHFFLTYI